MTQVAYRPQRRIPAGTPTGGQYPSPDNHSMITLTDSRHDAATSTAEQQIRHLVDHLNPSDRSSERWERAATAAGIDVADITAAEVQPGDVLIEGRSLIAVGRESPQFPGAYETVQIGIDEQWTTSTRMWIMADLRRVDRGGLDE